MQCIVVLIVPDLEQTCQIWIRSRSGTLPVLIMYIYISYMYIIYCEIKTTEIELNWIELNWIFFIVSGLPNSEIFIRSRTSQYCAMPDTHIPVSGTYFSPYPFWDFLRTCQFYHSQHLLLFVSTSIIFISQYHCYHGNSQKPWICILYTALYSWISLVALVMQQRFSPLVDGV